MLGQKIVNQQARRHGGFLEQGSDLYAGGLRRRINARQVMLVGQQHRIAQRRQGGHAAPEGQALVLVGRHFAGQVDFDQAHILGLAFGRGHRGADGGDHAHGMAGRRDDLDQGADLHPRVIGDAVLALQHRDGMAARHRHDVRQANGRGGGKAAALAERRRRRRGGGGRLFDVQGHATFPIFADGIWEAACALGRVTTAVVPAPGWLSR